MRVLFFPTLPFPKDGYSIAVCSDLNRLQPTQDDFVIWYNMDLYQETPPYGFKINGPSRFALKRYINLLKGNLSCEFTRKDLKNYQLPENPDSIFCGDIHFYRVLRSYYPHLNIDVRFHNCYSRISQRINLLGYANPNIKFKINLRGNCRLEKEIFNDNKTRKFFISDEDPRF